MAVNYPNNPTVGDEFTLPSGIIMVCEVGGSPAQWKPKPEFKNYLFPVSDVLSLRSIAGEFDGQQVSLTSYHDGWAALNEPPKGGGILVWDASSTAADDGGVTFAVIGVATGRWLRQLDSGSVGIEDFGAKLDGLNDDYSAIQAAVNCAASVIDTNGPYPRVTAKVTSGAGKIIIGEGKSISVPRGVEIRFAGRTLTWLYHQGGGVPCFIFGNPDVNAFNVEVAFSGFTVISQTPGATSAGIRLNRSIRNAEVKDVNIFRCSRNIEATNCWTLKLYGCDLQEATENNIYWENATAATIFDCRIDRAAGHNVLIKRAIDNDTVQLVMLATKVQFAGLSGIHFEDVSDAQVIGGYFEGNNAIGLGHADIESVVGPLNRGQFLGVSNCWGTATGVGASNSIFIKSERAEVAISNTRTYVGTGQQYEIGVDLGSAVPQCTIVGSRLEATSQRVRTASNNTRVYDLAKEDGRIAINSNQMQSADFMRVRLLQTTSDIVYEATSNLYYRISAPANRRLEYRLDTDGASDWFIGRGDSDESVPGDFYIARSSGGGTLPDLRVRKSDGAVILPRYIAQGPFADDAAAAAGGVILGATYRKTDGTIAWRQV